MGSCPGGIANLAIAASRLGVRTTLAAAFGDDVYGDFCWSTLSQQEGVDLGTSAAVRRVALAGDHLDGGRAGPGAAHPQPPAPVPDDQLFGTPPHCRAAFANLDPEPRDWYRAAKEAGTLLFADIGWDQDEKWPPCVLSQLEDFYAFLPNSVEAMAYTRTDDPMDAAQALSDKVPVAVVTCGGQGAIGIDSITGEHEWVPSLPVNAHDPTGAGDVFAAAFVLASLREWPLRQRLQFANLCAALSVQYVGGSLAAPGWGDIIDWLAEHPARAGDGSAAAAELAAAYDFIDDVLPDSGRISVRRARATIARTSDA